MKKENQQEIKKRILEELEKTKESIREYKEITKPISPENAIGRVSRMDAINNKSVVEAALRKAEEKYSKLRKDKGLDKDGLILPEKVAECYYYLSQQHRSTWTNEIDLRSFSDQPWWNTIGEQYNFK